MKIVLQSRKHASFFYQSNVVLVDGQRVILHVKLRYKYLFFSVSGIQPLDLLCNGLSYHPVGYHGGFL